MGAGRCKTRFYNHAQFCFDNLEKLGEKCSLERALELIVNAHVVATMKATDHDYPHTTLALDHDSFDEKVYIKLSSRQSPGAVFFRMASKFAQSGKDFPLSQITFDLITYTV